MSCIYDSECSLGGNGGAGSFVGAIDGIEIHDICGAGSLAGVVYRISIDLFNTNDTNDTSFIKATLLIRYMTGSFWRVVNSVIEDADILLEVLDARLVNETRNKEIEEKVLRSGKVMIYVINKCDLVEKKDLEKAKRKLRPCLFVSATERLGTGLLRKEIMKHAPKGKFKVGVLGYPNTGKSSVINALKGRASASTASISGHTKGVQLIKISQYMYLLDTPGVFPYREDDQTKHAIIAARTFSNLKDPEGTAMEIILAFPEQIESYYEVEHSEDPEEVLESIALHIRKLRKGGLPDINAAARSVLRDWQEGKIKK
ncbi:50S ribosome-binding GTPase [Candidatus Woesearchaeota archaeon]|nr:50S ribosome-binding GTPase [Candidatus Woesearchaeota archaeon]